MDVIVENMLLALLSVAIFPFIVILSFVIFLASIGKSAGLRRLYIKILLVIFEWGKERIARHEKSNPEESDEEDHQEGNHLIEREITLNNDGVMIANQRTVEDMKHQFHLTDGMYFCKSGIEAIIEDQVTQRFSAEELSSWNLLSRTNNTHEFISYRLTFLWFLGWMARYCILLPFRLMLTCIAIATLFFGTILVGSFPQGSLKKWLYYRVSVTAYRIMARAFSAVITFHNYENKAKGGGICVANHTSPIDIVCLSCDNTYAMVGQSHTGFFGFIQRCMLRGENHIWFHRTEVKDRLAVARRLAGHVRDSNKLPILIFPEGTCINNTSIMMFKKGSFEVGGTVYPCAIKYDPRFCDPFWNSSKQSFVAHLMMILSSWALVCDIWYLKPQTLQDGESAVEFANRIKAQIAEKGGLVDLDWDGALKRSKPKASMLHLQQQKYSELLKED